MNLAGVRLVVLVNPTARRAGAVIPEMPGARLLLEEDQRFSVTVVPRALRLFSKKEGADPKGRPR